MATTIKPSAGPAATLKTGKMENSEFHGLFVDALINI